MFDGFCGGCLARSQLRWLRVRPEHAPQPLNFVGGDLLGYRHWTTCPVHHHWSIHATVRARWMMMH